MKTIRTDSWKEVSSDRICIKGKVSHSQPKKGGISETLHARQEDNHYVLDVLNANNFSLRTSKSFLFCFKNGFFQKFLNIRVWLHNIYCTSREWGHNGKHIIKKQVLVASVIPDDWISLELQVHKKKKFFWKHWWLKVRHGWNYKLLKQLKHNFFVEGYN